MRRLLVWLRRRIPRPWLLRRIRRLQAEAAAAIALEATLRAELDAVRAARARMLEKIAGYTREAEAAAALNAEIAAAERMPAGFRGQA